MYMYERGLVFSIRSVFFALMLMCPSCMSAARARRPKDKRRRRRRTRGVPEVFRDTSESEASTFHGFEDDELANLLSGDRTGSPQCRQTS